MFAFVSKSWVSHYQTHTESCWLSHKISTANNFKHCLLFSVPPLDCSLVLVSSCIFSAWLKLLQEIAMKIVLAAKERTWPGSSPIQREERTKGQRTSRTELNGMRASVSSPFPGTTGFCWEPTISSDSTTTNTGTRHDPVRETGKREGDFFFSIPSLTAL